MIFEAVNGWGLAHALLAGPALLFASAAVSAVSSIAGGVAANNQAKADAAASEANAVEVGKSLASGDAIAERQQRALIGDTLTSVGANGLTLSGSALDVTRQNLVETEYERLVALREKAGQMAGLKYEAAAARSRGKQALFGGILGAAGSLAGGLGQSGWLDGAKGGGTPGGFIGAIKKTYQ